MEGGVEGSHLEGVVAVEVTVPNRATFDTITDSRILVVDISAELAKDSAGLSELPSLNDLLLVCRRVGASPLIDLRRLGAGLALVSALLLGGCLMDGGGDVSTAQTIARDYLSALAGESPDRGWSLILPESRRAYRGQEQYLSLVESTEWDDFDWRFLPDDDYCADGGVYCVIRLDITSALHSVPDFLLNAPQSQPDDMFFTLRLDEDPASEGNAEVIVYFGQSGQRGILLGGG